MQKIYESKLTTKIFCFPGNAGTSKLATNININILKFKKLLNLIKLYKIKLVVVGPEEPLVKGVADYLRKNKIKVFGPNKYASKLEGSKAFMKKICSAYNIPTAKFKICKNKNHVNKFLINSQFPVVVKADGLASGKGVSICKNKKEVIKKTSEIFKVELDPQKSYFRRVFKGEEASYFLVVDKNSFKFLELLKTTNVSMKKIKVPILGVWEPIHLHQ